MRSDLVQCGLHGCGTSLLYRLPRSSLGQVVSLAGCHGLDPWTYSFDINGGDYCRTVRNNADHLKG
jgi:hypothetical protein